jgi:CheY-like chemotaxis protein
MFKNRMASSKSSSTDPSTNQAGAAEKPIQILLVDADPAYLVPNRQRLEQEGYEVYTATDGPSALALATRLGPDLIVLAMVLPGMDGMATLKGLRAQEQTRAIPVIVLSSNTERRLVEGSRELGVVDYLSKRSKSDDPATLSAAVSAWLRSRRVPPPV